MIICSWATTFYSLPKQFFLVIDDTSLWSPGKTTNSIENIDNVRFTSKCYLSKNQINFQINLNLMNIKQYKISLVWRLNCSGTSLLLGIQVNLERANYYHKPEPFQSQIKSSKLVQTILLINTCYHFICRALTSHLVLGQGTFNLRKEAL